MWLALGVAGARAQCPEELRIYPTEEATALAGRAARLLSIRTSSRVEVADPPPGGMLEAVPDGHMALSVAEGAADLLFLLDGTRYRSTFPLPTDGTADDRARSVALTAESLCETAAHAPPPLEEPQIVTTTRYIGPMFPPVEIEPIAKPTVYLRVFAGYSGARQAWAVGPGTGLGLCVTRHCLVLEGELSLLPEEHETVRGTLRYRPVFAGMRLQLRPLDLGDVAPGATLGVFTRMGNARLAGERRFLTSVGVRSSVELAYRVAGPFELLIEGGVDYTFDQAVFKQGATIEDLDETWSAWAGTAVRLRP